MEIVDEQQARHEVVGRQHLQQAAPRRSSAIAVWITRSMPAP